MRLLLTIFILLVWSLPARAEWDVVMHDKRRYVTLDAVAKFYKMKRQISDGSKFRLSAPGRSIEGRANGQDVLINGVKYALCFPVISQNGKTLLSAMDVVKIIEPILRPQKIKNATEVRTVILDAGHGGYDSGARGPLGAEKAVALDVVLRAKKLLQANGYRVQCTRTDDTFVPLDDRVDFANRYANAIFISVHFNKSSTGGTGLETYCLAPRGVPSMDAKNLRYSDFVEYPGHHHDSENVALATCVHASLVRALGLTDRGIKRARFVVIKNIKIPGILVEGGFMNGSPDARMIATPAYRQKMAQCILEGVNRYKHVIDGEIKYQQPSAIVSATDPSSIPNLDGSSTTSSVGSQTPNETSVAQARDALNAATRKH